MHAMYVLSDERKRLMREIYDGKSETITRLCAQWRVPRSTLKQWAQIIGVAKPRTNRAWTEQEDHDLEMWLPRMEIVSIARKMNRSISSVALRVRYLRISKRPASGYNLDDLMEAFGCWDKVIRKWVDRGWLKGEQKNGVWHFSEQAVRSFMIRHPLEINQHAICWEWSVDILAGGRHGIGALEAPKDESSVS